jgi:hypothetical protein
MAGAAGHRACECTAVLLHRSLQIRYLIIWYAYHAAAPRVSSQFPLYPG